jgi:hypothetical protein
MLAAGGQGTVCMFEKVETKEMCAVKFDHSKDPHGALFIESMFLKDYKFPDIGGQLSCIPNYYYHGTED